MLELVQQPGSQVTDSISHSAAKSELRWCRTDDLPRIRDMSFLHYRDQWRCFLDRQDIRIRDMSFLHYRDQWRWCGESRPMALVRGGRLFLMLS